MIHEACLARSEARELAACRCAPRRARRLSCRHAAFCSCRLHGTEAPIAIKIALLWGGMRAFRLTWLWRVLLC
jgi:hypothetical protein